MVAVFCQTRLPLFPGPDQCRQYWFGLAQGSDCCLRIGDDDSSKHSDHNHRAEDCMQIAIYPMLGPRDGTISNANRSMMGLCANSEWPRLPVLVGLTALTSRLVVLSAAATTRISTCFGIRCRQRGPCRSRTANLGRIHVVLAHEFERPSLPMR